MGSLYLLIDLLVISIPFAFSWHPRIRFVDEWKSFWPACFGVLVFFVLWDSLFTTSGIWGFDDRFLVGASFLKLPVEEWLFFVCIPYACVFTYFVARQTWPLPLSASLPSRAVVALILVLSLILALTHVERLYTLTACSLAAAYSAWLLFRPPTWLSRMLKAQAVLAIPFVLTNGILTGLTFWTSPVIMTNPDLITEHIVWYNNAHNLAIRFFTIPFDDFFYAFALIGLNISTFEFIRERRSRNNSKDT